MTVKQIVLGLCCLMVASVCWGEYSTAYNMGTTDISGNLATVNAWMPSLPAKSLISIAHSGNGMIYILDSTGCAFSYDYQARTYTQKTAWGCGWSEIAIETPTGYTSMITLLKVDAGCPSGTKRWYRSINDGVIGSPYGCATHIYGGEDGTLFLINMASGPTTSNQYYNGSTYIDMGTGWFAGNAGGKNSICGIRWDAVTGGHVAQLYIASTSDNAPVFQLFNPQPPGEVVTKGWTGGLTECVINSDMMMVTTGTASYFWDFNPSNPNPTWRTAIGAVSHITGAQKATILGIVGGQPKHLNVFAGYIQAVLSGSFSGCPTDTQPCPPSGVTHTKQIQIHFPHGLAGAAGNVVGSPNDPTPVSSFDYSANCDLIFGSPYDPECLSPVTGAVVCSVIHASIYSPPPPPQCHDNQCTAPDPNSHPSLDNRHYDGDQFYDVAVQTTLQGGAVKEASVQCHVQNYSACTTAPPTFASCPVSELFAGVPFFVVEGKCTDYRLDGVHNCTDQDAIDDALIQCNRYVRGKGHASFYSRYTIDFAGVPHCMYQPPALLISHKDSAPCF